MLTSTPLSCRTSRSRYDSLLLLLELFKYLDAGLLDLNGGSLLGRLLLGQFLFGRKKLFSSAVEGHNWGACPAIVLDFLVNWDALHLIIILAEVEDVGRFVVRVLHLEELDPVDFLVRVDRGLTSTKVRRDLHLRSLFQRVVSICKCR